MIYHCVDVLNGAGLDARVVHRQPGFRCEWFSNETQLNVAGSIQWTDADIAVLPEIIGPECIDVPNGVKRVIFNQNAYYTFRGYALELNDQRTPYRDPALLGVLTVSADSRHYLSYAFPGVPVYQIRPSIDPSLFQLGRDKRNLIAFMPRKYSEDLRQVINLLKFRHSLGEFELAPIAGRRQEEVAAVLKQSKVFLHFTFQEGFGLPAAEAMACGCSVVGCHGQGGREFLRRPYAWPVAAGDVIGFCSQVEEVLDLWRQNPEEMYRRGEAGSQFIARRYSFDNECRDLVGAWQSIMKVMKSLN